MEELDETQQNVTETENTNVVSTENEATENKPVKTFTQEEVDSIVRKRLGRQERDLERRYQNEIDKYEEIVGLNQVGLKAKNLDDTLEKTRDFYKEKGITYTRKPRQSERDSEVLAKADSDEILGSIGSTAELEDEIMNYKSRSLDSREKLVLKNLEAGLASRRREDALNSIGAKTNITNSQDFKDFARKFNSDVPASDIYDLYVKTTKPTPKRESAGSMTNPSENKGIKSFYTPDEARKFTVEDYEKDPQLEEAVENSMSKW